MLMSIAVPRRIGTRGVSSIEMIGLGGLEAPSVELALASVDLNASMRPGLTLMVHSSGSILSQLPFSDHAKMDAIALEDFEG